MVQLLRALDFERYTPRTYILSEGDHLSASKANELELSKSVVSSCRQPICMLLIIVVAGPTWNNGPPTCSRSTSTTLHYSFQRVKVFRVLSDRDFGQAGAPGRTIGGLIAFEWARDVCGASRRCLFQSGTFVFFCISRVAESRSKLMRRSDSSLVCLLRG